MTTLKRWRTQGIVFFNFMTPLYPSTSPSQHSNALHFKNMKWKSTKGFSFLPLMYTYVVIPYHFIS